MHGELTSPDIGFVLPHDLIRHLPPCPFLSQGDRCPEHCATAGFALAWIDNLGGGQFALQFRDAALDEVQLSRGVCVFCILRRVAAQPRLGEICQSMGTHGASHQIEFLAQLRCAKNSIG